LALTGRRHGRQTLTAYRAFGELRKALTGTHRLLLVDEAENLSLAAFNGLRQLHDVSGCPLVFAGRPLVWTKIQDTTRDARIGGSLLRRMVIVRDLTARTRLPNGKGGQPLHSVAEVVEILARQKVRIARSAEGWITALANVVVYQDKEGCGLGAALNLAVLAAMSNPECRTLGVAELQEVNEDLFGLAYAAELKMQVEELMKRIA
jgi:hypothetical protein